MSDHQPTPSTPLPESIDPLGTRRTPGGRPGTYALRSDRAPRKNRHRQGPGMVLVAQLLATHRKPAVKPIPSVTLKPAVA